MSEVQKYEMDCTMEPSDTGSWVQYGKYRDLEIERDEWKARALTVESSEEDAQQAAAKFKAERDRLRDELAQCGGYDDYASMIAEIEGRKV